MRLQKSTLSVNNPFSLIELKYIEADLVNYSNNPDKYINAFQHLPLAYELTWKDTIVVLRQTLSDLEQERVIKEVRMITNNLHSSDSKHPTGESVPLVDMNGATITPPPNGNEITF